MRHDLPIGTVDVPDGWSDDSVYRFSSPAEAGLAAPLATARGVKLALTRATFGVTRVQLETEAAPKDVASAQLAGFRGLPGFRLESEAPWRHPTLGELAAIEMSYEGAPEMRVRQVIVYVPAPNRAVLCMTFSAAYARFAERRQAFEAVVASMSPR